VEVIRRAKILVCSCSSTSLSFSGVGGSSEHQLDRKAAATAMAAAEDISIV
jgi:hypothetical protein